MAQSYDEASQLRLRMKLGAGSRFVRAAATRLRESRCVRNVLVAYSGYGVGARYTNLIGKYAGTRLERECGWRGARAARALARRQPH